MLKNIKNILFFLIFFMIMITFTSSYGNPFLVSSPQSYGDPNCGMGYKISWDNGSTWLECGKEQISATEMRVMHDMAGIEIGRHDILVKTYNLWGESDAVPFGFTKELPVSPTNLGLVELEP